MSGSDKGGISDEDERRDEVLKRMLNTKPQKHKKKDELPKRVVSRKARSPSEEEPGS